MDKDTLLELEIKELFATMRTFLTILVQALSVLGVANITVIGFAIANKTAGMFLLGALINIFTLFIFVYADILLLSPIYYRMAIINKNLGKDKVEFFPDFLATFYRHSLPQELINLSEIIDVKRRTSELHRLFLPTKTRFSKRVFILIAAATIHLGLIPILIYLFDWKIF